MKTVLRQFLSDFRNPDGYAGCIFSSDFIGQIPSKKGVYIIVSDHQKFIYPNGESKVIYIGTSDNLFLRLNSHQKISVALKQTKISERIYDWHYSRYQYIAKFGGNVFWFTTRGTQTKKVLEEDILDRFYNRFLALPVGNGAFSFGN